MYGPHPDPDAVARLTALLEPPDVAEDAEPQEPAVPPTVSAPRARWLRFGVPIAGLTALAVIAAAIGGQQTREIDHPVVTASPSSTLLAPDRQILVAFSRPGVPGTSRNEVTYQPNGYTLIDPHGAALRAKLVCSGAGTVVVNLTDGTRFTFYCVEQQLDQVLLDSHPHTKPFLVIAATTGNVVWDLTISAVQDQWRADLD